MTVHSITLGFLIWWNNFVMGGKKKAKTKGKTKIPYWLQWKAATYPIVCTIMHFMYSLHWDDDCKIQQVGQWNLVIWLCDVFWPVSDCSELFSLVAICVRLLNAAYIYSKLELLAGWRGEGQEARVRAFAIEEVHSWAPPIAVRLYSVSYSWEEKKGLTGLSFIRPVVLKNLSDSAFTY